jgi:hypothetical protein
VAATDWSYRGPARLRWKWRADGPGLAEVADIVEAWERGRIEELMAGCLEKVVVENRCNSTQPPGDGLVPLALVSGLLANLDETIAFTSAASYPFWMRLLDDSTPELASPRSH